MKKYTGSVELKWSVPINKKLKVIVSFFSVKIYGFTYSKTRHIYETLIRKTLVDTLRPLTLHKFMQNKNYQVYFIVQPSDSVSHLALFEFLDFVTKQSRFFFLQYFQ